MTSSKTLTPLTLRKAFSWLNMHIQYLDICMCVRVYLCMGIDYIVVCARFTQGFTNWYVFRVLYQIVDCSF